MLDIYYSLEPFTTRDSLLRAESKSIINMACMQCRMQSISICKFYIKLHKLRSKSCAMCMVDCNIHCIVTSCSRSVSAESLYRLYVYLCYCTRSCIYARIWIFSYSNFGSFFIPNLDLFLFQIGIDLFLFRQLLPTEAPIKLNLLLSFAWVDVVTKERQLLITSDAFAR